jgi:hypothetical protein
MADSNFIPQIDYTSRDYSTIKADLISLIPNYLPEWTSRDAGDFGIVMIELFSYMGDVLNFYIDRSANEAFINTASQRTNVLQLASLLGYIPTYATPSTVTLTFQNSTDTPKVVPALTKVATSNSSSVSKKQIIFETDKEVTVPAAIGATAGSITVKATQGETVTSEPAIDATGEPNQEVKLSKLDIIPNSISVTVGTKPYDRVDYLIDYDTGDAVVASRKDADGYTWLLFGDNISGRIPPANTPITVTYRVGGGADGNVPANSITYILTNGVGGLSVKNQNILTDTDGAATGGSDEESTDSIRINAPTSMRAVNRAVSIADYANLAVQVTGVSKANARGDSYSSITLYLKPAGDTGLELDGVTPSDVFNAIALKVNEFLVNKAPANTSVTYQPPKYVPVDCIINVTASPKKLQAKVKTEVGNVFSELLKIDYVFFEDSINAQDIYTAIQSLDGVLKSNILLLQRQEEVASASITNKVASGTEATLTTSAAHSFKMGDTVYISGVDSTFDGARVITNIPSSTSFKYELISTAVASAAVSPVGSAKKLVVDDISCEVNEIPTLGSLTVNVSGGITA